MSHTRKCAIALNMRASEATACEYNHLVPHFMPVEDFYVRIQQRVPRVERGGIRSGKQTSKILAKSAILFWGMLQRSK